MARSLHRSLKEVSWQDLLDNTRLPRTHTLRELCSRYALQHFTRAISDGNLKEKCRTPEPRRTLCASLRNQNACQHCRRATLHRNLQVKCRRPERAQNADTHTHTLSASLHACQHIQKFTGKMPQTRRSTERRHTLCASLRIRNACQHCRRATSYGNLQVKCCRPEWAQNPDTHFVRARAVEMHVNIAEEPHEPRTQTHTLCEPAQSVEMHVSIAEEPLHTEVYR